MYDFSFFFVVVRLWVGGGGVTRGSGPAPPPANGGSSSSSRDFRVPKRFPRAASQCQTCGVSINVPPSRPPTQVLPCPLGEAPVVDFVADPSLGRSRDRLARVTE